VALLKQVLGGKKYEIPKNVLDAQPKAKAKAKATPVKK
jgi:hypothetical protein